MTRATAAAGTSGRSTSMITAASTDGSASRAARPARRLDPMPVTCSLFATTNDVGGQDRGHLLGRRTHHDPLSIGAVQRAEGTQHPGPVTGVDHGLGHAETPAGTRCQHQPSDHRGAEWCRRCSPTADKPRVSQRPGPGAEGRLITVVGCWYGSDPDGRGKVSSPNGDSEPCRSVTSSLTTISPSAGSGQVGVGALGPLLTGGHGSSFGEAVGAAISVGPLVHVHHRGPAPPAQPGAHDRRRRAPWRSSPLTPRHGVGGARYYR